MRPAILKEHFTKVHPGSSGESLESLKQKRARFKSSGTLPKLGFVSTQKPLLEASYRVVYLIAKNKKAHTIGESLVKPCALQMVETVLGEKQRNQIVQIPLSNDIRCRILDMSCDVLAQLVEELKKVTLPFALQLDESTDEAQFCQLLAYVRYATNTCIKEDFLFCEPLLGTTKAFDVYRLIDEFFSKNEWGRNLVLVPWCSGRLHT